MENSYIKASDVKKNGRTAYYKMLERVRMGELVKVRRGVYATVDQLSAGMVDVGAVVPNGILCLWSAWSIHKLTTSLPQAFHVAVERGRKINLPEFPQMQIHYCSEPVLAVGVADMVVEGFWVSVYDVERSVCDAVKFRNKIGIDVCAEILNNYLERQDRNMGKLMDYARRLRVGGILEKYLQVKL